MRTGTSRPRGRPREFDLNEALDRAIRVFSEHGYHGTSIPDLVSGMRLTSGSIYKAFKDKRAVFLAALDHYIALRKAQIAAAALNSKSARERLRDVLAFFVESSKGPDGRRGCMVVGSAVELAALDREVATRVNSSIRTNETVLADLIRLGQREKSIPLDIDPDNTARVMVCFTQGLRVLGKSGRAPLDTNATVDIALKLVT